MFVRGGFGRPARSIRVHCHKAQVSETEWGAGHDTGIPAHETVIRVPARLVPILKEACDVAERRAGLR